MTILSDPWVIKSSEWQIESLICVMSRAVNLYYNELDKYEFFPSDVNSLYDGIKASANPTIYYKQLYKLYNASNQIKNHECSMNVFTGIRLPNFQTYSNMVIEEYDFGGDTQENQEAVLEKLAEIAESADSEDDYFAEVSNFIEEHMYNTGLQLPLVAGNNALERNDWETSKSIF